MREEAGQESREKGFILPAYPLPLLSLPAPRSALLGAIKFPVAFFKISTLPLFVFVTRWH